MEKIIEKYRDVHEKLKDNPPIQLQVPRHHNYRAIGLKPNSVETILEQRERKVVGNNGEPTGYSNDEKTMHR